MGTNSRKTGGKGGLKPETNDTPSIASDSSTATLAATSQDVGPNEVCATASLFPEGLTMEFAKLTALILEKSQALDNKLETIRLTTNATDTKLADFAKRMSAVEDRVGLLEDANENQRRHLEENPPVTAKDLEALRNKLDDIENRNRRNNLRFVGFPEDCEKNKPLEFLGQFLKETFNLPGVEMDRAHRMGPVREQDPNKTGPPPPRPIIARFLRFQDRDRISEAARNMGKINWNGHHIMVFADYSKLVTEKRMKFNDCKTLLHEKHVKFSLDFPAVLTVKPTRGAPRRFEDSKKALAYIRTL